VELSYTIAQNPDAGELRRKRNINIPPLHYLPRAFVLGPGLLPLPPFPLRKKEAYGCDYMSRPSPSFSSPPPNQKASPPAENQFHSSPVDPNSAGARRAPGRNITKLISPLLHPSPPDDVPSAASEVLPLPKRHRGLQQSTERRTLSLGASGRSDTPLAYPLYIPATPRGTATTSRRDGIQPRVPTPCTPAPPRDPRGRRGRARRPSPDGAASQPPNDIAAVPVVRLPTSNIFHFRHLAWYSAAVFGLTTNR